MSATPQDVSSQIQDQAGSQSQFAQQYYPLVTPPPMDSATIDKLEAQIPKPTLLTAPEAPLTPEQEQSTKSDITAKQATQADVDRAQIDEIKASGARQEKLTEAEIGAMESAQPPEAPKQNANPLQRMAPLLLLTAFGGKATKLDANAMLGATIGTVNGYLQGNQQQFDNATKQYDEAYKRFQDRQKQQTEIYDKLRAAYGDRADADMKALQMAHQLTEDEITVDQNRLQMQDHWRAAVDKIAETNDKLNNEYYDRRARLEMQRRKEVKDEAAANIPDDQLRTLAQTAIKTGHDPAFGMGQSPIRQRYLSIKADEIKKAGGAGGVVGAQAQTRLANTEGATLGRQKANLDRVEHALADPGGIGDQAIEASRKLSPSNLRTVNRISQLFQREFSDPALVDYRLKMLALRDEFATVINRGGQPTEGSRQQATEEMDKFQVNAVPAIVKAIRDTAGANSRALTAETQGLGRTAEGSSPAQLPERARAALKEGTTTRFANGQAWTLQNGQPVQVQ